MILGKVAEDPLPSGSSSPLCPHQALCPAQQAGTHWASCIPAGIDQTPAYSECRTGSSGKLGLSMGAQAQSYTLCGAAPTPGLGSALAPCYDRAREDHLVPKSHSRAGTGLRNIPWVLFSSYKLHLKGASCKNKKLLSPLPG